MAKALYTRTLVSSYAVLWFLAGVVASVHTLTDVAILICVVLVLQYLSRATIIIVCTRPALPHNSDLRSRMDLMSARRISDAI